MKQKNILENKKRKFFPDTLDDMAIEEIIIKYKQSTNPKGIIEYEKKLFSRLSNYTLAIQERIKKNLLTDKQRIALSRCEDNNIL